MQYLETDNAFLQLVAALLRAKMYSRNAEKVSSISHITKHPFDCDAKRRLFTDSMIIYSGAYICRQWCGSDSVRLRTVPWGCLLSALLV